MITDLYVTLRLDSAKAKKAIWDALVGANGSRKGAADALGCSYRTLMRTISAMGLWQEIDARWPDRAHGKFASAKPRKYASQ